MKVFKTLLFAGMAALAFGAASCDKEKKANNTNESESVCTLDSIMDVAAKGEVAQLNCDSVLTTDTKVETTTVICFVAEDAPACAPLQEPMARLAADNEGKVAVIAVDVTACPKTAASFGLDEETPLVPCVVILNPDGEMQTYPDLGSFITPALEKKSAEEQADGIYATLLKYAGINE
ncbi:MAG: hypothetical protein K2N16_05055 [Muribaculaceae bacterium]|nr:hypothetical protein [Muribaculaceae bacterium]